MVNKIKSGIESLDDMAKGGLPAGSAIMILGQPGTGKSTFLREFIGQSIKEREKCIYVLSNSSPEDVKENMEKFGWDIKYKDVRFILYDGFVRDDTTDIVGNFNDLIDVSYHIEQLLIKDEKHKIKRIVIDELSYFYLMNKKEDVFKFLQKVLQTARKTKNTCLIEIQRGILEDSIVTAIESLTDGTIELKKESDGKYFKVSRMEDIEVEDKWVLFGIKEGAGIDSDKGPPSLSRWEDMLKGPENAGQKMPVMRSENFKVGKETTLKKIKNRITGG